MLHFLAQSVLSLIRPLQPQTPSHPLTSSDEAMAGRKGVMYYKAKSQPHRECYAEALCEVRHKLELPALSLS